MDIPSGSKTIEEQLAILNAILETAVDAIITIDRFGVILHANPAVGELFQYDETELIGANVSMLMPSPIREEHNGYLQEYLKTGEAHIIGSGREVKARRKDNTLIDVDLAVSEVRVGDEILFTGILRDMTSRIEAEDSARRERTFSNNLTDTANAVVVVLDIHGKIARINPFMEALSGYKLSQVRGKDWFEIFLDEQIRHEQRDIFQEILLGKLLNSHVHSIVTQNGTVRTVTWSGCVLHDADDVREGVLFVGNDITDLVEAESRLIEKERLAAIGQMVTGLAHESRNALQRARAALDVLELDADAPSAQLISQTQSALSELQHLYEEVRNYAAPIRLDFSNSDLVHLCQQTWEQLVEILDGKRIDLKIINHLSTPHVKIDVLRMRQVFRNIFENAIAVSPDQSEIVLTCRETSIDSQRQLSLTVEDAGPGFTDEQLENIFTPFFTTKTKGTGLGMPIAKRCVQAHDGTIHAENRESGGARILISIPAPDRLETPSDESCSTIV